MRLVAWTYHVQGGSVLIIFQTDVGDVIIGGQSRVVHCDCGTDNGQKQWTGVIWALHSITSLESPSLLQSLFH